MGRASRSRNWWAPPPGASGSNGGRRKPLSGFTCRATCSTKWPPRCGVSCARRSMNWPIAASPSCWRGSSATFASSTGSAANWPCSGWTTKRGSSKALRTRLCSTGTASNSRKTSSWCCKGACNPTISAAGGGSRGRGGGGWAARAGGVGVRGGRLGDWPAARCRFGKYLHVVLRDEAPDQLPDIARLVREFAPRSEETDEGESLLHRLRVRIGLRCSAEDAAAVAELQLGESAGFYPSDAALAAWTAQAGAARVVYDDAAGAA